MVIEFCKQYLFCLQLLLYAKTLNQLKGMKKEKEKLSKAFSGRRRGRGRISGKGKRMQPAPGRPHPFFISNNRSIPAAPESSHLHVWSASPTPDMRSADRARRAGRLEPRTILLFVRRSERLPVRPRRGREPGMPARWTHPEKPGSRCTSFRSGRMSRSVPDVR